MSKQAVEERRGWASDIAGVIAQRRSSWVAKEEPVTYLLFRQKRIPSPSAR